jgi:hypothetical protein
LLSARACLGDINDISLTYQGDTVTVLEVN